MTRALDLIRRSRILRRASEQASDEKMKALFSIRANTLARKAAREENQREHYEWLDCIIAIQENKGVQL